jgi:hypothetical protein
VWRGSFAAGQTSWDVIAHDVGLFFFVFLRVMASRRWGVATVRSVAYKWKCQSAHTPLQRWLMHGLLCGVPSMLLSAATYVPLRCACYVQHDAELVPDCTCVCTHYMLKLAHCEVLFAWSALLCGNYWLMPLSILLLVLTADELLQRPLHMSSLLRRICCSFVCCFLAHS